MTQYSLDGIRDLSPVEYWDRLWCVHIVEIHLSVFRKTNTKLDAWPPDIVGSFKEKVSQYDKTLRQLDFFMNPNSNGRSLMFPRIYQAFFFEPIPPELEEAISSLESKFNLYNL